MSVQLVNQCCRAQLLPLLPTSVIKIYPSFIVINALSLSKSAPPSKCCRRQPSFFLSLPDSPSSPPTRLNNSLHRARNIHTIPDHRNSIFRARLLVIVEIIAVQKPNNHDRRRPTRSFSGPRSRGRLLRWYVTPPTQLLRIPMLSRIHLPMADNLNFYFQSAVYHQRCCKTLKSLPTSSA